MSYSWLGAGLVSTWLAWKYSISDIVEIKGVEHVAKGDQLEAMTSRKGEWIVFARKNSIEAEKTYKS